MKERVDRRVLGGFVCVDAISGSSVLPALQATATDMTVKANRSGVHVVFNATGLESLTQQFVPAGTWPAPAAFEVTLSDPDRRYLPRRAMLNMPQPVPLIPPAPVARTGVFVPQQVPVYPSPATPIGSSWASIHVSVTLAGTTPPQGLPWAALRVVRTSDNAVIATGQTDANGEGLLAVIGLTVQANTSGQGPVTVSTVAATITAYFDPGVQSMPANWIPNPDDILTNVANPALKSAGQALQLTSGQETAMNFAIAV